MNNKAKWLISLYDDNCEKIAQTIQYCGYEVKCVGRNDNLNNQRWWEAFASNDCVVFMGSLQFARDVEKRRTFFNSPVNWVPGAICDLNFFKYSNYSQYIGKDLLNWPYTIVNSKCFDDMRDWLFEVHGNSNCIFVRPDTGFKTFTGEVVYGEKLVNYDDYFNLYGKLEGELVIVSEPKNLRAEYRIVIVEGKYISGSTYRLDGKLEQNNIDDCIEFEGELCDFCEKVAENIPHAVYVMDIGLVGDEYKVIELNSFSCSGMYKCDMKKVIPAVSDWAYKEWKEHQ